MACKIFSSHNLKDLEEKLNRWLKEQPSIIQVQLTSTYLDDPVEHIIQHVVIVFYTPMHAL